MISDEEYLKKISKAKRPKSTTDTHDVSGSAPPPSRPSAAAFMDYWKFFSPPTEEKELEGKWCSCIYMQGKKELLCLGKIQKQFLVDERNCGAIKSLMIDCCVKEQAGSPGKYENIGDHLPRDVDFFPTHNIVAPVKMEPLKGGK